MLKYKHSIHKLNPFPLLLVLFLFTWNLFGQIDTPLQQGKWIKLAVTQSGFYTINPAWLAKHHIENTQPDKICIYAANKGMLNPNELYQNGLLMPITAYYQGGTTSNWSILFWGESPHALRQQETWKQETNLYSDSTYYFIQLDAAKTNPIEEIDNVPSNVPFLPYAWSLKHYEPETYNLLQSGQTWLGDAFYGNSSKILQYTLPDYLSGQAAYLNVKLFASSVSPSTFTIPIIDKSISIKPILGGRYDNKSFGEDISTWTSPVLTNKSWTWPINFQSTGGTGYLDYISFMYPKGFDANYENPLYLLPNKTDSLLNITIPNLRASQQIWINNGGITWKKLARNASFSYSFHPNSQLAIANLEQANEPIFCGQIGNQNTFNIAADTELLILSSSPLENVASNFAKYKTSQRNIKAKNITTQAIFNDFSGGKQDVTAIRNFIRFQFQKQGSKLKYVILLGDASIDYKGKNVVSTALEKACFVPTYQSEESFHPLLSYASDDYYGIFPEGSGVWKEGENLQVAIGRIPAKNPQEAEMFVNKLKEFESKQLTAPPRFAWVADDGDSNIHMQDAEDFSTMLQKALFPVQQEKLYLDQYPMQLSNGVYTSPSGTKALVNLFEEKADFIHFMGHGSESGWTDEKLLTTNELIKLKNNTHLPILLTATCQFGRYDDPNILSGGEVSLLSDQGGAIALISTTRPVFQSSNYLFGQAFYRSMLANKENGNYRLGDLFRDAKNASQAGVINRNIHLLGDPTLALPWTSKNLPAELDTSKQEILLKGLAQGAKIQMGLFRISDAQKTLGTKNTEFQYPVMSSLIWKSAGESSSNTSTLSTKSMPSLNPSQRYQLHIWSVDGNAKYASAIEPEQWKNKQKTENIAPIIKIELLAEDLNATSRNPWLSVSLADSSGLMWQNVTGEIAYIVLDDSVQIDLGSKFIPDINNPKRGALTHQLKSLKPGVHKIQAFCWDIYNNYAQASLSFQVKQDELESMNGYMYPNPLGPTFHFVFKQEKPWNSMPYEIQVFDLLGKEILRKKGLSSYFIDDQGMIEFEWAAAEIEKLNHNMILQIKLEDPMTNKILVFRQKTSTLK